MSDGIADGAEVVGVFTEQIEAHFGMEMGRLKAAVAAAPNAHPGATEVVRWHGLLVEAQSVLDRAEDDLLAVLEAQPSEVDDPTMRLAQGVNEAVTARDELALRMRRLLDPGARDARDLTAERLSGHRSRTGPLVQTAAPFRPAGAPAPTSGPRAGRAVR